MVLTNAPVCRVHQEDTTLQRPTIGKQAHPCAALPPRAVKLTHAMTSTATPLHAFTGRVVSRRIAAALCHWRRGGPGLPSMPKVLVASGLMALAMSANAATQALVMWIGDYPQREARLKGSAADGRLGVQIAQQLGATIPGQLVRLKDEQLDFEHLSLALQDFRNRLRPGDTAVIYFSGHGRRTAKVSAPGCREGLVAHDNRIYFDIFLRDELDAIAKVASRVVMFNDSCHAGGAVTKALDQRELSHDDDDTYQVKVHPGDGRPAATASADCDRPSNLKPKSLPRGGLADRIVYLAAARDDEVAYSTPAGSLATQGWAACLADPAADSNRDGFVSAGELSACAQRWIERNHPRRTQHLEVVTGDAEPLIPAPRR